MTQYHKCGLCPPPPGVTTLLSDVVLATGARHGSATLHRRLLRACLHSPLCVFDTTPVGRMVCRFSQDLGSVDSALPRTLKWLWRCVLEVGGTLVVIACTAPAFPALVLPMAALYFFVQVITTLSPLLTTSTRSPGGARNGVYNLFSAWLIDCSVCK